MIQQFGPYKIDSLISDNGHAQIYRATHEHLLTPHAIKLLPISHPDLQRRLIMEGRIQARLRHPSIVQVTDVVERNGMIGLVMEFIVGDTLEGWLQRSGPPSLNEGLQLFNSILDAVEVAHQVNILHLDLKPGNVLLQATSQGMLAKVTDFGISQTLHFASANKHALPAGTAGYMSPEQVCGDDSLGPYTDIFSLGTILFELLSGEPAYDPAQSPSAPYRVTADQPCPDIKARLPSCPPHIHNALERAMSRAPRARPQTCSEFRALLYPGSRPSLAVIPLKEWKLDGTSTAPSHVTLIPEAEELALLQSAHPEPAPASPRRLLPVVLLGGVALALLCVGILSRGGGQGARPTSPEAVVLQTPGEVTAAEPPPAAITAAQSPAAVRTAAEPPPAAPEAAEPLSAVSTAAQTPPAVSTATQSRPAASGAAQSPPAVRTAAQPVEPEASPALAALAPSSQAARTAPPRAEPVAPRKEPAPVASAASPPAVQDDEPARAEDVAVAEVDAREPAPAGAGDDDEAVSSQLSDLSVDVVGDQVVIRGQVDGADARPLHYLMEDGTAHYVIRYADTSSSLGLSHLPVGSGLVHGISIREGESGLTITIDSSSAEMAPRFERTGDGFTLILDQPDGAAL